MGRRARLVLRATAALGVTATSVVKVEVLERWKGPSRRAEYVAQHLPGWCRGMLWCAGVAPQVGGAARPAGTRGRLIVSNHRSPIDIPILMGAFGGTVVSRGDLSRWPLMGTAARKAGTIFVDRSDRMSGARAIRVMRRALEEGGTIIVFPEATTHAGDSVRPFRAGAFRAVVGLPVDVVPVGIAYPSGTEWSGGSFVGHLSRVAGRPRTTVTVEVGDSFEAGPSAPDLAAHAHREVQRLTHLARDRHRAG